MSCQGNQNRGCSHLFVCICSSQNLSMYITSKIEQEEKRMSFLQNNFGLVAWLYLPPKLTSICSANSIIISQYDTNTLRVDYLLGSEPFETNKAGIQFSRKSPLCTALQDLHLLAALAWQFIIIPLNTRKTTIDLKS